MSVAATADLEETNFKVNGWPILQAEASVSGDASGGSWTLRILWPRDLGNLYIPIDLQIGGLGSGTFSLNVDGHYVRTRGTSFRNKSVNTAFDSSGNSTAAFGMEWLQSTPWMAYHQGQGAADFPALRATGSNNNGTTFFLGLSVLRVPELLERPVGRFVIPDWPR